MSEVTLNFKAQNMILIQKLELLTQNISQYFRFYLKARQHISPWPVIQQPNKGYPLVRRNMWMNHERAAGKECHLRLRLGEDMPYAG